MRKHIHDITKWFLLWKEKKIVIPPDEMVLSDLCIKSDHIIVISIVLREQRKVLGLSKSKDDNLLICKVQR